MYTPEEIQAKLAGKTRADYDAIDALNQTAAKLLLKAPAKYAHDRACAPDYCTGAWPQHSELAAAATCGVCLRAAAAPDGTCNAAQASMHRNRERASAPLRDALHARRTHAWRSHRVQTLAGPAAHCAAAGGGVQPWLVLARLQLRRLRRSLRVWVRGGPSSECPCVNACRV
jgi:hypothetical protein